jgi:5'-nucleotidase
MRFVSINHQIAAVCRVGFERDDLFLQQTPPSMRVLLSLLLIVLLGATACAPRRTNKEENTAHRSLHTFEFYLLQINDVYEITPMRDNRGGLARFATLRKKLMEINPHVLTILSGDYLSPSLIGSLKCGADGKQPVAGKHMVEVLNAIGVDYVTFGNHEFDVKEPDLLARMDESKFKMISANVLHQTQSGLKPFQQNGKDVPAHWVHAWPLPSGDTFRLGLSGVTLNFNKAKYVAYLDPYNQAQIAIDQLHNQAGADLCVMLTHLTKEMDDTLASRIPGVPVLLGGHEHVNMVRKTPAGTLYKADANAKTAWIHRFVVDLQSNSVRHEPLLFPITEVLPEDPNVQQVVQKWLEFSWDCMQSQGYKPLDTIAFSLEPLDGREDVVRSSQTLLGKMISDGIQATDPEVQCVLVNSGSIRVDDILQGFILQQDILATLPFGGGVKKGKIRGQDLERILKAGLSENIKGNGAYLQAADIDQRGNEFWLDDKPVDMAGTYIVALPAFLANGGEPALSFIKELGPFQDLALPPGTPNDIRDILISYLKTAGNLEVARQLVPTRGRK